MSFDYPKRYQPEDAEPRLRKLWEEWGIYKFDPDSDKPIFSVDTPPPYVSSAHLHVGNIKLSHINFDHSFSENISYFIGPVDRQGMGYATEAVKRVSQFGFEDLGLYRIEAGAHATHGATIRVLEKSGYHLESTCVGKMRRHGTREDQLIYVRFNEEQDNE